MKRLLRITVLFSVTLLWWGEKGYAATPAMDAAEKETVSATVEAEADKKDPKSDKKSDEPKRKRNLGHLSGSFETNTIYYVEDSKTGAVVPHNSYGSNNFLKLDYQLGRFSAGVQLEYYPHPLVGTLSVLVEDEHVGSYIHVQCTLEVLVLIVGHHQIGSPTAAGRQSLGSGNRPGIIDRNSHNPEVCFVQPVDHLLADGV